MTRDHHVTSNTWSNQLPTQNSFLVLFVFLLDILSLVLKREVESGKREKTYVLLENPGQITGRTKKGDI